MSNLDISIDPRDVGLDPTRLARIEKHFSKYVDDGKLPGFHITVSRAGANPPWRSEL